MPTPRRERSPSCTFKGAFTFIEALVVVAILATVALLAVPKMRGVAENAQRTAAESDLRVLRDALTDPATGYLRDFRGIPGFSVGYLRVANLLMPTNLYGAVCDGGVLTTGCRVDIARDGRFPRDAKVRGYATPETFLRWNPETQRGWRGPYVKHPSGIFPARSDVRRADDATFENRGFFPPLRGLRLPDDFLNRKAGCSIYGFPGEPAVIDPWGNPYVLQIPPPQAFPNANTNIPDEVRFHYARFVSAGPDGRLDTPCFGVNMTNWWFTAWTEDARRLSRQAGRNGTDTSLRGDDLILFVNREDTDDDFDR